MAHAEGIEFGNTSIANKRLSLPAGESGTEAGGRTPDRQARDLGFHHPDGSHPHQTDVEQNPLIL